MQEDDAQKEAKIEYDEECIPKGVYQIRDDSQQWQGASVVTTVAESMPPAYSYVPGKYIVSESKKGVSYKPLDQSEEYGIVERYIINVYDIQSGAIIKEIDIKEVLESYLEIKGFVDYGIAHGWGGASYRDGRYVWYACAENIEDYPQNQETRLEFYIDFETEEVIEIEDWSYPDEEWRDRDLSEAYYIFFSWGRDEQEDLFNINGLRSLGIYEEKKANFIEYDIEKKADSSTSVKIRLTGDLLPEKNTKLYSLLPELKQYQGDEEACVVIYFDNRPNPEEVLRLFLEDGQEISYEGFEYVLFSNETIDGKERRIYNFEEFDQWYLPHAERPENEGMEYED